jgi:ABC-type multidrug transport system ATPase subunit
MQISLTNAGKSFNREWIFFNLNYSFLPNTIYAITGPNGSGKSTLLQVLSGSMALNKGVCEWKLNNADIQSDEAHNYVAMAAPYLELIEEMTANEFLSFHSNFKSYINNFSPETILKEANLLHAANKQVRFFSSGMKQRLKLAQAIFSDMPVILLDEPCTNLDAAGFELYYKWIKDHCSKRLIIISSNDKDEYSFADKELNILSFKK